MRDSAPAPMERSVNITDDFLRKYKFDERRTEEMEQKTFNVAK